MGLGRAAKLDLVYAFMAKRPTKPEAHSWVVYHLKGTPAKLVGIVYDQPDAESAIKQAIEEYKVPAKLRGRLMAQRRER